MNNLFLVGILVPLLALAPVVYAQNIGSNYVNSEAFNQAKNTSLGLVNQAKSLIKNDTNSSKLMSLLEGDVGNLINKLTNMFSK
jgi:hypothetical protein